MCDNQKEQCAAMLILFDEYCEKIKAMAKEKNVDLSKIKFVAVKE